MRRRCNCPRSCNCPRCDELPLRQISLVSKASDTSFTVEGVNVAGGKHQMSGRSAWPQAAPQAGHLVHLGHAPGVRGSRIEPVLVLTPRTDSIRVPVLGVLRRPPMATEETPQCSHGAPPQLETASMLHLPASIVQTSPHDPPWAPICIVRACGQAASGASISMIINPDRNRHHICLPHHTAHDRQHFRDTSARPEPGRPQMMGLHQEQQDFRVSD
jgi:hypothetical protein